MSVEITVTGSCGHVIGTWTDRIAEKYPFYCAECGEVCTGRYPWTLTTRIVDDAREIATEVLGEYLDGKIVHSPSANILASALVRIIREGA